MKHTPGDVNHQFLAEAGHDFCYQCGVSLRGKWTMLETEMLEALEGLMAEMVNGQNVPSCRTMEDIQAVIRKARKIIEANP